MRGRESYVGRREAKKENRKRVSEGHDKQTDQGRKRDENEARGRGRKRG